MTGQLCAGPYLFEKLLQDDSEQQAFDADPKAIQKLILPEI